MRKAFVVPIMLAAAALSLPGRASAAIITYQAVLNGAAEGTNSLGTGFALVTINDVTNMMHIQASFAGLTQTGSTGTTASHIHCCTAVPGTGAAGVATTGAAIEEFCADGGVGNLRPIVG